MSFTQSKYLSPFTDYGFKKIFGEEASKNSLISFLNDILLVEKKNQNNLVFYDKLSYIHIEFPKFNKKMDELSNHLEKWLYFLKNLETFEKLPDILQEPVFVETLERVELLSLDKDELFKYERGLKHYRDRINEIATAIDEGREEKAIEIAINLLDVLDNKTIAAKTGLSYSEVEVLRTKNS
jgi:predicted transposase/invertase (TIGR01784 family)